MIAQNLSVCLVNARAHTEGTYLPAGHYPRGPLHVPTTQQGADTPTHPAGTGMGRARAMAISHPRTSLALKYKPCTHGAPPVLRHVDRPFRPDPRHIEQTRSPRRALS